MHLPSKHAGVDPAVIHAVEQAINLTNGPLKVTGWSTSGTHRNADVLSWDQLFSIVAEPRGGVACLPDGTAIFLLTPIPNELNWFGAARRDGAARDFFIHTDDWDWFTSAPLPTLITYEIVQFIMMFGLSEAQRALLIPCGDVNREFAHEQTSGCINDFCEEKRDFALKLRTADICEGCLKQLEEYGASQELLTQVVELLEVCRQAATSTARYIATKPSFTEWAYPVALTRHKATQAREPVLRFHLLMDHFDCMVRFALFVHLAQQGSQLEHRDRPSLGWWLAQRFLYGLPTMLRQPWHRPGTSDPFGCWP